MPQRKKTKKPESVPITSCWQLLQWVTYTTFYLSLLLALAYIIERYKAPPQTDNLLDDFISRLPSHDTTNYYNPHFFKEACSLEPDIILANKIDRQTKYSVGILPDYRRLLVADKRFKSRQEIDALGNRMFELQQAANAVQQLNLEKAKQLLGDIQLTKHEQQVFNRLVSILSDTQAAQQTKSVVCGISVNMSMGKIIADCQANNQPIPAMIGLSLRYDFDQGLDAPVIYRKGFHFLENHHTLLLADDSATSNLQRLMELRNLLKQHSDPENQMLFWQPEDAIKAIDLFQAMDTQVCDAWGDDQQSFNTARAIGDPYLELLEHPERIYNMWIITQQDLENPRLTRIIDFVFNDHAELWSDAPSSLNYSR